MEVTNLMLLKLFRQCSHMQLHRLSRFQGQGRLLILINERGTITQRELTEITQRRPATLSEQLEAMEIAGLIMREKNAADKRNIDICLTGKGKQTALEAEKERAETANALFSVLDEEEKARLYQSLQKLNAVWQNYETVEQPTNEALV